MDPETAPGMDVKDMGLADRVFGVIGGVAVLLGLVFLVWSLAGGPADGQASTAPQLRILAPAPGAEVGQPVVVEFDAGTPLLPAAGGWMADGRHLHLFAGATELMPAPADLRPVSGTRYRWTLPRLPAGPTTLHLTWSGDTHRSLAEGASDTVAVRLR